MNVARFAARIHTGQTEVVESVITGHVMSIPAISDVQLVNIGEAVGNWWVDGWEDNEPLPLEPGSWLHQATYTILEDVTVRRIQPALSDPVTVPVGVAGPSPNVGDAPPQVSLCVTLVTDLDSRSGRGRIYTPPPALGFATGYGGKIATVVQEQAGRVYAALAKNINAIGATEETPDGPLKLAVYSRAHELVNAVVFFRIADRLATQRRRMPGPRTYLHVGLNGSPEEGP